MCVLLVVNNEVGCLPGPPPCCATEGLGTLLTYLLFIRCHVLFLLISRCFNYDAFLHNLTILFGNNRKYHVFTDPPCIGLQTARLMLRYAFTLIILILGLIIIIIII